MLPDHEILNRLLNVGDLVIDPPPERYRIQPASVDITLGDDFRTYRRQTYRVVALDDIPDDLTHARHSEGGGVTLPPGEFVLATTAEHFTIPPDLCAFLHGRSTLGRLGIAVHVTAGLVDPGYVGELTLEIANVGPLTVHLRPGDAIGQITFEQLDSAASRPYGHEGLASRYQHQVGATAPRAVPGVARLADIVELRRGSTP